MKKLSPAQLAMLSAMAEGQELRHRQYPPGFSLHGAVGTARNANANTVHAVRGFIEVAKEDWMSTVYRLNAAGRAVVKAKAPAAPATRGKGKVKR